MGTYFRPKRHRGVVILAFVLVSLPGPPRSRAQPGTAGRLVAPQLTAVQQRRLQERDRYAAQTQQLRDEGKLPEAIAAAEKMLAIERKVFGKVHEEVAGSFAYLADLHAARDDFAAARTARQEVLTVYTKLYGDKDWRVTDARRSLEDLDRLARFAPAGRQQFRQAVALRRQAVRLQSSRRFADAERLYKEALEIWKSMLGEKHPEYASCLNSLGSLLHAQGDYPGALDHYRRALAMREGLYPKDQYPHGHPELAQSVNNVGILLGNKGDYAGAREYLQRALAMGEAQYPQGHPYVARALENLGLLLKDMGDLPGAREYLQRSLAMRETLYPKDRYPHGHPELDQSLVGLGALLRAQGDSPGARDYYRRALAMNEALYPKEKYPQGHPDLATSLNNLGDLLCTQGDFPGAREYLQRALALREALYPKGHPHLVQSQVNLGLLLRDQGDYDEAREYLQRAVVACEALYPKTRYPRGHPELARTLNILGLVLEDQGDYPRAREYQQRSLAVREALYPKEQYPHGHAALAVGLHNMGLALSNVGDFPGAREYLQRSLAIREALYPRDRYPQGHLDLASSLDNLGNLLRRQGDYPRARAYLQRTVAMHEALYPKDRFPRGHPDLAVSLNHLGALLFVQGDYPGALEYCRRALAIYEAYYPKGHPNVAHGLNHLGSFLRAQGDYREARVHLQRSLTIREALYPKDRYPRGHPDLAGSLNELGLLLRDQGNYSGALDYHRRALAMYEAFHPKEHPHVAVGLNNVGLLLDDLGDYPGALDYYRRALAMSEALYPKDQYPHGHPQLAVSLSHLGAPLNAQGDYREAQECLLRALEMQKDLADVVLGAVSEAEALNFLATLPGTRDAFLSVSRHLRNTDDASYSVIWHSKAALFRILHNRHQAALQTTDPEARRLWQELIQTRRDLARMLLAPSRYSKTASQQARQLNERKEELERQLAQKLPEFRRQSALRQTSPADLLSRLPAQTVFIDLLRYIRIEQDPEVKGKKGQQRAPHYVAFVLCRGQPIQRVELGPAEPIETAVAAWRRDIPEEPTSPAAETLGRLLWQPLAAHLRPDTRAVLLAPDGALTRLPWAALPGRTSGAVLLEEYALGIVPHGPFLLHRLTAERPPDDGTGLLLAVGGVHYDQQPDAVTLPQGDRPVRRSAEGDGPGFAQYRAQIGGVFAFSLWGPLHVLPVLPLEPARLSWPYLPGALDEVNAVVARAGPRPVLPRRGAGASTDQLLLDLPRARWVHLATHGFFADPKFRSVLQVDEDLFWHHDFGGRASPGTRNPFVLSGLVLAGANRPPDRDNYGVPQGDGGILTAEAIAQLPLAQQELVVLSACETGLGDVAGGEGVFGLQRAFHQAGAHTVVASLWKVDDDLTRPLMARFYDNLWQKGMGRLEALREAQLWMVKHGPGNSGHPRYWAAWVLSGDPGELPAAAAAVPPAEASPRRLAVLLLLGVLVGVVALVFGVRRWNGRRHRLNPTKQIG
jgi:tetratricopeptide (TPR) repeat protein